MGVRVSGPGGRRRGISASRPGDGGVAALWRACSNGYGRTGQAGTVGRYGSLVGFLSCWRLAGGVGAAVEAAERDD